MSVASPSLPRSLSPSPPHSPPLTPIPPPPNPPHPPPASFRGACWPRPLCRYIRPSHSPRPPLNCLLIITSQRSRLLLCNSTAFQWQTRELSCYWPEVATPIPARPRPLPHGRHILIMGLYRDKVRLVSDLIFGFADLFDIFIRIFTLFCII